MRGCGAVLVVLGACVDADLEPTPSVLTLGVEERSPFAVGSTTRLTVVNTECGWFESPDGTCAARPEDVFEHSVDLPGVFEVVRTGTQFDVAAVAEGSTGFYVDVISRGQPLRLGYNLIAKTIDTVSLQTSCASPVLKQTGIAMAFSYEMRHGNDRLSGRIMPFTIVGAQLLPPDEYGVPWLQLPDNPGTVTITSPYDPDFVHQIDVVGPDSIDGLAISDPRAPLVVGSLTDVRANLLVGMRAICHGSRPVTTTISTPGRCALDPGYGSHSDTIRVRGLAAGDCTVHVTLAGTSLSATKTFPVM